MSSRGTIVVTDLCFEYEAGLVLENLSLKIQAGELIGLIGPNGGGKTTFLKLLMGFLVPTSGSLFLSGEIPKKMRCRVGYVPQIHRMDRDFPITVRELVLLGALFRASPLRGYPISVVQRAEALLEELGLLAYQDRSFSCLSGGLAQRALLARALLADPEFLFLDEPTAHIDAPSVEVMGTLLDRLRGSKTILLVTHDLRAIQGRVDRILCVEKQAQFYSPDQMCAHMRMGLYQL